MMVLHGFKKLTGLKALAMSVMALIFAATGTARATTTFTLTPSSGIANPVSTTSGASSSGTALSSATIYASQGILTSTNASSLGIPGGLCFSLTSAAATTGSESTGVLSVTLPAGVSFVTIPTATLLSTSVTGTTSTSTGPIAVGGIAAGKLSNNGRTLSYGLTIAAQSAASTATIQLTGFTVTGAVVMTTPGNSLNIQAQVTGFVTNGTSTINMNDTAPITGIIAVSASGVNGQALPGPGDTIAIASGSIASSFNSYDVAAATGAGTPTVLSQVADLGKIAVSANSAALNAPATLAYYASTNTGTLSVSGTFSNYTGAYLSPGSVCTSTTPPAGAIVATVSSTSLSFAQVPLSGALQAICLISSGSSLLSPTGPLTASFTIGGQTQVLSTLGTTGVVYAGTPFNLTYVFSKVGNFQGYLRMVNTTANAQPVFGIARNDAGQVSTGLIATLPPQSAQLITHDAAFAALGASGIFPTGTRGVLTALTPAPAIGSAIPGVSSGNAAGVSVTSLVLNPTTDVTNVY